MDKNAFLETLAAIKTGLDKLKESKGQENHSPMEAMRDEMMERMYGALNYVHERISGVEDTLWEFRSQHLKGHLPNPKTPTQMERALKGLGLQDEFEVVKPMISVASTRQGQVLNASYSKES